VFSDGAAYDPERDRWRRLAPAPLRPAPAPVLGVGLEAELDAAWTGAELIVRGGTASHNLADFTAAGASYDPERRRWRVLPEAPIAGRDRHAAVWTGEAMLVWGGCCRGDRYHADGALYRPE
jgi:hypothetical protein